MADDSTESQEQTDTFPGYENSNSYSQDALRSVLLAIKSTNDLPGAGDDFDYYNTFPGFRAFMMKEGKSILSIMTSLVKSQGVRETFETKELEEKFDLLADVNDAILENVSNYIDEASGVKKPEENLVFITKANSINTSWNRKEFSPNTQRQNCVLLGAKNIQRPQMKFKDKVDNSNSPFVPILTEKPHSIKPLAVILEKSGDEEHFCHPYEWEIEKFEPAEGHLTVIEPIVPKTLLETPLVFVQSVGELRKMCEELKMAKEVAIDLEHHSFRSFQGFTCLMQISTRSTDYIVDTLELRAELGILNEVFADPKIVKVLHGADMDVLWLQRDFGLYLVNLFDTGQAARVLHFPHLSLAYLLSHYCKLNVDKKFQLADWRIRPLPTEMVKYAREDTHYLLYVYDRMKSDLVQKGNKTKNLLHSVFDRSKLLCLKRYEKPLFKDNHYLNTYRKSNKAFNPRQLFCLKQLYTWRDKICRDYDESYGYVLPNHMMLRIAEALPREQQGIGACCNPTPALVLQNLNELHNLILKVNDTFLAQLETGEEQEISFEEPDPIDLNSIIQCPHDILDQDHTNTDSTEAISSRLVQETSLSTFCTDLPKKSRPLDAVLQIFRKLISPFQRYEMSKKILEAQQAAKAEKPQQSAPVQEERYTNQDAPVKTPTTTAPAKMPQKSCTKKGKKNKRPAPDIPLVNPPKKSCTPEKRPNFQPFDYSRTDLTQFEGKKTAQDSFKGNMQQKSKRAKKPYGGKKKTGRQGIFGRGQKGGNKNWPKK